MIEPMKKVSIVLLNKEKEEALKALRRVGLVHLEKIEGAGENLQPLKNIQITQCLQRQFLEKLSFQSRRKDRLQVFQMKE